MTDERTARPAMQAATPFDPHQAGPFMMRFGHGAFLGTRFRDAGEDWCELEQPWREDLVGQPERDVLASGPILSMMDMATSMAVWTRRGVFVPHVTLDLKVDYMQPATRGSVVIGRGECYKLTRSMSFVRGIAYEEALGMDDPIAHVTGAFMLLQGEKEG